MGNNKPGSILSRLGFLVFKGFAWLISKTPFFILYGLSDFFFVLLYHVIGYRKKVVTENLRNSFPENSPESLRFIREKFYHHLVDLILEIIKYPGMNSEQFKKRCFIRNPEIADTLIAKGKSIIFVTGHTGNFEWTAQTLLTTFFGLDHYNGIVKPLTNPLFENYMAHTIREKLRKNMVVPFKQAFRTLISQRNDTSITCIVADQTPHKDEITYWTRFLNQDTAFFLGTEKMAKALSLAVIFMHVEKTHRGFYEITLETITEVPKNTSESEITEKHIHLLEDDIRKYPDIWLWSHRRWKYKKENYTEKHTGN